MLYIILYYFENKENDFCDKKKHLCFEERKE